MQALAEAAVPFAAVFWAVVAIVAPVAVSVRLVYNCIDMDSVGYWFGYCLYVGAFFCTCLTTSRGA